MPLARARRQGAVKRLAALFLCGAGLVTAAHADSGVEIFTKNCAPCHQAGAVGLPSEYPRLAGRVRAISATRAGRRYIIDVLSFGMTGVVTVDGRSIEKGAMPTFNWLDAAEIASVISYVQTLGAAGSREPVSLTPTEVAARRKQTAARSIDTYAERQRLVRAKVIP